MSATVTGQRVQTNFGTYIKSVMAGRNLAQAEMHEAIQEIILGQASPAQIAALLIALAAKGETAEEIAAAAEGLRERAIPISCDRTPLVDVCGTGGDNSGSFNVSTTVAFIVAGAGVAVAKHGNRAISSHCGSADVLAALGVDIEMSPGRTAQLLNEHGIAFLFAPAYHQATRHVSAIRKELGVRTLFNLLGPLTNPARPTHQVVGVFSSSVQHLVAQSLRSLGCKRSAVVHSEDGLDEISLSAPTHVVESSGSELREYILTPEMLGISRCDPSEVCGGDASYNAQLLIDVLDNRPSKHANVALINAAVALYICGYAADIASGLKLARQSLSSGEARKKLEVLIEASNA